MNPRRLYRCRHDRQLAGVAAGMAEYLEVDPTVVRILWILSAFVGGFTILLYVILAFVIPLEPETAPGAGTWAAPAQPGPAGGETGSAAWDDPAGPAAIESPGEAGAAFVPVAPAHRHQSRGGGGGAGMFVGVLLVVFGLIALGNVVVPGVIGHGLFGAGLLVALGVAFLAVSVRRTA